MLQPGATYKQLYIPTDGRWSKSAGADGVGSAGADSDGADGVGSANTSCSADSDGADGVGYANTSYMLIPSAKKELHGIRTTPPKTLRPNPPFMR